MLFRFLLALGLFKFLANCCNVVRLLPAVAPAKTATGTGGTDCKERFKFRISLRLTMMTEFSIFQK
jgi:hypothetical protein